MKVLVIANPASGSFRRPLFDKTVEVLKRRAAEVDVAFTESAGHATSIARDADAGLIIAAGGDGLIHEVVNGIADKRCFFSVLPFGTANVFSRELGMSQYPVIAAKQLNPNTHMPAFVGMIGERYFIQMSGFGADAEVVRRVTGLGKVSNKALAHVIEGAKAVVQTRFPSFKVYSGGVERTGYHCILSLGRRYAGSFPLSRAVPNGNLHGYMITKPGVLPLLVNALSMVCYQGFRGERFETEVAKVEGVPYCQVDGEFMELPAQSAYVRVKAAAFKIIR